MKYEIEKFVSCRTVRQMLVFKTYLSLKFIRVLHHIKNTKKATVTFDLYDYVRRNYDNSQTKGGTILNR